MASVHGNEDQIAYWNGPTGQRWTEQQETMDASLLPMAEAALAAAQARDGEHVLDVGCGTGATSLMLAERVGAHGSVLGVDISRPMLARARERAAGHGNMQFIEADACVHGFAPKSIDLLFSRFGVMFFADPLAAFQNLHKAMKPAGRMAFVCWRPLSENPFALVPMGVALKHLPPQPAPDPTAPGPFAFGDRERVSGLLSKAGFKDVRFTPLNTTMVMARKPETAAKEAVYVGMASRLLKDAPEEVKQKVVAELTQAFAQHLGPDGVTFPAHCWVVTGRA